MITDWRQRSLQRAGARFLLQRLHRPALTLHFSERRLLLLLGDVLALNVGLWTAMRLRSDFALQQPVDWQYGLWFAILSGLWLGVGNLLDIYNLGRAADRLRSISAAGSAALLTVPLYLLIPFITPPLPERRLEGAVFLVLAVGGIAAWRFLYATLLAQPGFRRRALVIGMGQAPRMLADASAPRAGADDNRSAIELCYQVVGFVDTTATPSIEGAEGVPILRDYPRLSAMIAASHPDEIVVALPPWQEASDALMRAILDAQEHGIRITTMTMVYERLTGKLALDIVGPRFDIVLPLSWSAGHSLYLAARRLIELALSLVGCLAVVAVIPPIWLANRIASPGPLFYRQERVTKGGAIFHVIKFRSMVVDAEKDTGAVWASTNDARITPIGRLLRKLRIDELPQFWNILRGEMSLIGPRPERPQFVERLDRTLPFYRVRHSIRPGLTGWAQVNYRYASSLDDSQVKLQYDLYYVKHQRPSLDLLILLKTVQIVLGFKGR